MIYSQKRKISASLCGTEATLSVVGTLSLVEDALTELCGELEIDGLTAMRRYNAVIVFAKNHIRFFGTARWNEDILVESFVSSKKRMSFCVDTAIYNGAHEMLVYSRIELCGIDKETGSLRRIDTMGVDEHVEVEAPAIDITFFSQKPHAPAFVEQVKVRSCNIDYVHHTNNIEYMKFILNTRSVAETERCAIGEMELSYKSQSFEGDELEIYAEQTDGARYYEIRKQDVPVLKCEMLLLHGMG